MRLNLSRRDVLSRAPLGLVAGAGLVGVNALAQVLSQAATHDTINPYQFGAVGNGLADDTAALQRAISTAIAQDIILDLARGTYRVTGSIIGNGNIRVINSGGAIIEAAKGNYTSLGVLVFAGHASLVGRLAASTRKGSTQLGISGAGFVKGDLGVIYDPTDSSFSGFRRYYRAGEYFEVGAISGRTLSLSRPLNGSYGKAAAQVHKIHPIRGYLRDIIVRAHGGPESVIAIDYASGFEVSNPRLTCANNSGLVFRRSFRCTVVNPAIENAGSGGDDYGLSWSNSQHCRVQGGTIYSRRHAVAVGGADEVNCVPCRDIVVEGSTLRNDASTRVHCADIHGNSEECGYTRCVIFGGFSPQGRSSFLRDSTVHSMSTGSTVYAAEILGGVHAIEGNTFYFSTDPSRVTRGAIDFGGNSDAITANTVENLTIVVRNNTFKSSSFSGNTMLLYARNAGTPNEINIRFTDNDLQVNDYSSAIRLRRDGGQAKTRFLVVADNTTSLRGRRLVYPDSDYAVLGQMQ